MEASKIIIKEKHSLKESFKLDLRTLSNLEPAITDVLTEVVQEDMGNKPVVNYVRSMLSSSIAMFIDELEDNGGDVEFANYEISDFLRRLSKQILLMSNEVMGNY